MEFLKNRLIIEFAENNECISNPKHVKCSSICNLKYYDMARYVQRRLAYPTNKDAITVPEAKKRWECLLREYLSELKRLRIAKKKYIESGSTRKEPKSYWTYFDDMNYLEKYYPNDEHNTRDDNTVPTSAYR